MIRDQTKAKEGLGASGSVALAERSNHETLWRIDRYDADIHERKVKGLKAKIGEMLILANYHFARGDHKSWFQYVKEAEKLRAEAENFGYNQSEIQGNLLLNEGIDEVWLLVVGSGGVAYNNTNSQLGVGDSTAVVAATQTDLQAATNNLFKGMNAGFPTSGTQKASWQSDFLSAEGNYAWQEFSVRNGLAANKNLNRALSVEGTKTSGQTWTLTLDITLS